MNLTSSLCELALRAGAVAAGFAPTDYDETDFRIYHDWLKAGNHAAMEYMRTGAEPRFNPDMVLEGARSALCAAFSYAPATPDDSHPLFSDYARGLDYHIVLRERLRPVAEAMEAAAPGSRTRICTDSAPVRERFLAHRAGIGAYTRSGMIYVPGAGTQVFLAEILWTETVESQDIKPEIPCPCADCSACIRACPGGALKGNGTLDARKCLSYLTIEHKGDLPDTLRLPARIYGCDVCVRVCPLNRQHSPALPELRLRPALQAVHEEELENMSTSAYRRLSDGSAISRVPLSRLRRNLKKH